MFTMEYYPPIKKNEVLTFAAKLAKLKIITLSEISQRQKDAYCLFAHTWKLKINNRYF